MHRLRRRDWAVWGKHLCLPHFFIVKGVQENTVSMEKKVKNKCNPSLYRLSRLNIMKSEIVDAVKLFNLPVKADERGGG